MKKKFAESKKLSKFAIPFEKRTEQFFKRNFGSIAQLVQSVCLTSRGSGVRLPLLPQKIGLEFHSRPLFFVSDTLRTAQTFQEPDHSPEPPTLTRRSRQHPTGVDAQRRGVNSLPDAYKGSIGGSTPSARPDCRRLLAAKSPLDCFAFRSRPTKIWQADAIITQWA